MGRRLDFTRGAPIGARIRDSFPQLLIGHGYDHNLVLDRPSPTDTSLTVAARVWEPTSHRVLDIYTTEPGTQSYSGNFLDGSLVGTSGRTYRQSDGFALEAALPWFAEPRELPSTVLGPGREYTSTRIYQFSTGPR